MSPLLKFQTFPDEIEEKYYSEYVMSKNIATPQKLFAVITAQHSSLNNSKF